MELRKTTWPKSSIIRRAGFTYMSSGRCYCMKYENGIFKIWIDGRKCSAIKGTTEEMLELVNGEIISQCLMMWWCYLTLFQQSLKQFYECTDKRNEMKLSMDHSFDRPLVIFILQNWENEKLLSVVSERSITLWWNHLTKFS